MIHSSKSLATQVAKVKRISVTGICLPDHFGGFFQKLKILRLKLGLFSWSDWISGRAIPPVSWGKEVKSTAAVNLATCMFLTASAKRCCCSPALKESLQALWEFPWQPRMASSQEPFLVVSIWSAFGTKRNIARRVGQVFSLKRCSTHLQLGSASPSSPRLPTPMRILSELTSRL